MIPVERQSESGLLWGRWSYSNKPRPWIPLKAGVADIANIGLTSNAQALPLNAIFSYPGLEFPDQVRDGYITQYKAYLQISQKYPALSKELADFKLLFWVPNPAYRIITKSKKIVVPDDLKGVKIASSGKAQDR